MPTELYLIAHVVNAQSEETAEVEFEVASESGDEWYTNDGRRVWPFYTIPLNQCLDMYYMDGNPDRPMKPPEGWLSYLADEAIRYATENAGPGKLDALLGLVAPVQTHGTFKRRF